MASGKVRIPQSEAEWIQTGQFETGFIQVFDRKIRYAATVVPNHTRVVTMVGGIPKDVSRRENLPLINKLYGLLALELTRVGIKSVLYNQPATGQSGGRWEEETLHTRASVLTELVNHFSARSGTKHTIIGSSAGAYMALQTLEMLEEQTVNKLVLLSPAAYPGCVETVPYGPNFTAAISSNWPVAESPVFARIEEYVVGGGNLFLSFFEADDPPIPQPIQAHFRTIASRLANNGGAVQSTTILGVGHNFRRIIVKKNQNLIDNQAVVRTVETLLQFIA